jgi:hypothetical protein
MIDGLLPSEPISGTIRVDRVLPVEARAWGRILDMSHLEPGDLILTRRIDPNEHRLSLAIMRAQEGLGLPGRHAQWTHAAVYLGDDVYIVEANFKTQGYASEVILRSAFGYCDGRHAIRARRPRDMTSKERLRIAIGALTRLGTPYSRRQIFQFWLTANSRRGFRQLARGPRLSANALVCSTLYQDALSFARQENSPMRFGIMCTPAHLSADEGFEPNDPPLAWLGIE